MHGEYNRTADGSLAFPTEPEEIRSLCEQIRTYLPEYELSDDDILAISQIFGGRNSNGACLPMLPSDIFSSLRMKGIIEGATATKHDTDSAKPVPLVFKKEFLYRLAPRLDETVEPFASLREYYVEWFSYVRRLHEYRSNEREQHPSSADAEKAKNPTGTSKPRLAATERDFQRSFGTLLQRSCKCTNPFPMEVLVRNLELDDDERRIVLFLLYSSFSKKDCYSDDLLTLISSDPFDQYQKEDFLSPASKLRLFDVMTVDTSRYRRSAERSAVRLNPLVRKWLLTGGSSTDIIPDLLATGRPYASNKEYLRDWIRYISGVIQAKDLKDDEGFDFDEFDFGDDDGDKAPAGEYLPILNRLRDLITARARISEQTFPLQALIDEFELSEVERDILLTALNGYLKKKTYRVSLVSGMLRKDEFEDEPRRLFQKTSKLVKHGLILDPSNNLPPGRLVLTTHAIETLLGKKRSRTATVRELISDSEILHEITPQQNLDDLVLPTSLMETLRTAVSRYESNAEDLLRKWGIVAPDGNAASGSSLTMLFSGPTGTGKTFSAGALANALGRSIVSTDISKLLSHWVGVSEQLVVRMFDEYRALVERLPDAPVLLLNECDQFFMRRMIEAERSVDRMYKQMQNIFLERLETFSGVLIATTNLVESIDEAFSRRFHYKLEFPFPDARARRTLWEQHLKPPIPLNEDVDLTALSEEYGCNGGQIALIVRNAAIRAAIRGDRIRMSDLRKACEEEQQGTFDPKSMKRQPLGFTGT